MALEGKQIGRYHLLHLLGSGGMGEVYLAEDARIEQQVAIKVLRTASGYSNAAAKEVARLFQREAKVIAKLDHPHILPLFDYGEAKVNGMTLTYLVMPYRKEGSFVAWLNEHRDTSILFPQEIGHFLAQAADALQHAHDRQIIHQDIKPSNFLIRSKKDAPNRPDLLLADFGVAKFSSVSASMNFSVRGTSTYMAPEQWMGQPVPGSDQYALAIMIYELLTGHPPFHGRPEQVMYVYSSSLAQANTAATARMNTIATNVIATLAAQATATTLYPYVSGQPRYDDPLKDNSKGNGWEMKPFCQFKAGTFHVSADMGNFTPCIATKTNLSNFVLEVHMRILQGDCGGVVFRRNGVAEYFLRLCKESTYTLIRYVSNSDLMMDKSILDGFSPLIHTGLNQLNQIDVVAIGSRIEVFINQQYVASVVDRGTPAFVEGQIGLYAKSENNQVPTDVTFSNLKVWML